MGLRNNPEVHRKYMIWYQGVLRRRQKEKAVAYKGGSCEKCGYSRSVAALEFHHRLPSGKDFGLAKTYRNWDVVEAELDKCDMLCANCHREIHEIWKQEERDISEVELRSQVKIHCSTDRRRIKKS